MDLPPGWVVGESWPAQTDDVIRGWIAAPSTTTPGGWSSLSYSIGWDPELPVQALKEDPRYEITESEILGVKMAVRVAAPDAESGNQFAAYYERIPGAPDGVSAPRLDISWSRSLHFGFENSDPLPRVLKSVRYAELPSLPEIPAPGMVAPDDWVRKIAGSDGGEDEVFFGGSFSLRLPPGWTTTERNGVDGAIGAITGDGIELTYYNPMSIPSGQTREEPHLLAWQEQIDGLVLSLVRPVSPVPDSEAETAVMIWPFIDGGGPNVYASSIKMSVIGKGLDGDQQELVLAILRTIQVVKDD